MAPANARGARASGGYEAESLEMRMRSGGWFLLWLAAACGDSNRAPDTDAPADTDLQVDTDTPATDTGGTDTDPSTPGGPELSVDVVWSGFSPSSSLEVTVHDPEGRTDWRFGLAETEAGVAGWYGEDCYLGTGAYTLCHAFSGSALTLDQVGAPGEVVEGATTLLWSGMNLTYYLDDGAGSCWVWGHDPSWYAALGCTDLDTGATWSRRGACSGMDPHDPAPLGGRVALTFDDGPHPTVTPQVLAILRAYGVPATFFMLGENVADPARWPLVQEIVDDPLFDVGNHSWDHADLALLSEADVRAEVEDTNALLETFTGGVPPARFRFPYGDSTCFTADLVRDVYGQTPTGWHVDTADWCYAAGGGTCTRSDYWRISAGFETDMRGYVLDQVAAFDGGVVLLHDIHQYTADQLEDLILDLLAAGYTFTSLDDAAAFPNLVADTPFDFPWVGEACDTSHDTCWQVEWNAWCEPTGDPSQPATAGVCVLPCGEASECIDRDGTAPLACVDALPGGTCLARSEPINARCADVPGTVEAALSGWPSGAGADVCQPYAW